MGAKVGSGRNEYDLPWPVGVRAKSAAALMGLGDGPDTAPGLPPPTPRPIRPQVAAKP